MTASKYRKRPVVIEAYQWLKNGDHPEDRVGEDLHDPFTGDTYQRLEGAVVRFYRHPRIDGQARLRRAQQYTPTVALDLPPATRPDLYAVAGIRGVA